MVYITGYGPSLFPNTGATSCDRSLSTWEVVCNKLRKVPVSELEEWDATHDKAGGRIDTLAEEIQVQTKSSETSFDKLEIKRDTNAIPDTSV